MGVPQDPGRARQARAPGLGDERFARCFASLSPPANGARSRRAYRTWTEPPQAAEGFGPFDRREFPMSHVISSAGQTTPFLRFPVVHNGQPHSNGDPFRRSTHPSGHVTASPLSSSRCSAKLGS